ncbi:hypothetical protein CDO26_06445 [Sinorhizobium meliloti]|uniref:hypothetical protein n=1 Tax=Rhizobium meliloti TaxID=382 RepID=UPI000B4A139F|nr:hypothetical protein [Sinorhizobium meliloti]ASP84278.1 hypothetical protein CDO26_06445 [Sinorhizobium meliloti]MQW24380.1 hypothetical protein [Sinorhizobium meliloti]
MISAENKLIDMTGLNRFRIGDEVVAEACAEHDRFEGVVIGIELQRVYASRVLQPSITLLHDGDQITDGFNPDDLRKINAVPDLHRTVVDYLAAIGAEPEKDIWDTWDGKPADGAEKTSSDAAWADHGQRIENCLSSVRAAVGKAGEA